MAWDTFRHSAIPVHFCQIPVVCKDGSEVLRDMSMSMIIMNWQTCRRCMSRKVEIGEHICQKDRKQKLRRANKISGRRRKGRVLTMRDKQPWSCHSEQERVLNKFLSGCFLTGLLRRNTVLLTPHKATFTLRMYPMSHPRLLPASQKQMSSSEAPDKATYLEIDFEEGEPVALDGHKLSLASLLAQLNKVPDIFL